MKLNVFSLLAACFFVALASGCYSTPDGRMRPGVPFAKDTIENRYLRPVDVIFNEAKNVLLFNGTLHGENTINNTLEAKVDNRTIWVQVDEVEPRVSRVRVTARKAGGAPDIDLASEIATQIALKLK